MESVIYINQKHLPGFKNLEGVGMKKGYRYSGECGNSGKTGKIL
jgi:hypothetical protein